MTNAQEFMKMFAGIEDKPKVPHVSLSKCRFRLLDIQPYYKWEKTGEIKEDGSPKWAQVKELVTDDTDEKVRCEVSLLITDEGGLSTSASSPFIYNKLFLSKNELGKIKAGEEIKLKYPRIEFKEIAIEKKGFKSVETRMNFVFDGFEF